MLRFSPLLLVVAASAAVAQEAPVQPATTAPASAAPAPAAAVAVPAAAAPTTAVNARLNPTGLMQSASTFPLGMQVNLSNSLGNGVLAPGYQSQPQFSTVLSLAPNIRVPKIEGLPMMVVSGGINFSMGNWLLASSDSGVYARQLRVSDASVRFVLPRLYVEEFTGIAANLSFNASAPLSIGSRQNNVITSLGVAAPLNWSSPDSAIGSFFVSYAPSVRSTIYSQVAATMPCSDFQEYGTPRPLGDPVNGFQDLPTFIPAREVQVLDNGDCALPGRQRLFSINQGLTGAWSSTDGAHSVSLSLGWTHSFVRPLSTKPELSSQFASGQNFSESTGGSVGYSYTVPVDFPLQLSLSAGSENTPFQINPDGSQVPRFPVWDFYFPANNASGVSLDVTIGI